MTSPDENAAACAGMRPVVLPRLLLVAAAVYVWLHHTSLLERGVAVIAATAFAGIETTWTTLTQTLPDGRVVAATWRSARLGHSSFCQFWANVLYTPILLFVYRAVVRHAALRVVLFPLNVWALEVIEGYAIMFLFSGRNVAWTYSGKDAYFHVRAFT